ncbi:hypothetical protein BWI17_00565 [Betaproteobacteria bacterium GR16-43]|nr:hypothetical protein BWI17_00565 [Betaproteobacteria bacterium GR16-43]
MDADKKRRIAYFVAMGAALLLIAFTFGPPYVLNGPPITGEVVSVEGPLEAKEALVKLESGRIVRAAIPSACVVFPGQIASILESGGKFTLQGTSNRK